MRHVSEEELPVVRSMWGEMEGYVPMIWLGFLLAWPVFLVLVLGLAEHVRCAIGTLKRASI